VLDRRHRLTSSAGFTSATRRGRRAGSSTLVLHLVAGTTSDRDPHGGPGAAARVGFVVSRAVGNAVTRNRVRRRLRHLLRDRCAGLPHGSVLVVRALPTAAVATSATLARDLDRCLDRLLGPSPSGVVR
jgi:ribonuclease P protein component